MPKKKPKLSKTMKRALAEAGSMGGRASSSHLSKQERIARAKHAAEVRHHGLSSEERAQDLKEAQDIVASIRAGWRARVLELLKQEPALSLAQVAEQLQREQRFYLNYEQALRFVRKVDTERAAKFAWSAGEITVVTEGGAE